MVADECEGNDAYGFEETRVNYYRAVYFASRFGRYAEALCDYSDDDYGHAYQGEAAGFSELQDVS